MPKRSVLFTDTGIKIPLVQHTFVARSITRVYTSRFVCVCVCVCVSSLRMGHANLLYIVPILTDDPRREFVIIMFNTIYIYIYIHTYIDVYPFNIRVCAFDPRVLSMKAPLGSYPAGRRGVPARSQAEISNYIA